MALEAQRPGERKWGYLWYTAAAYNEIEVKRQKTLAALDEVERKALQAKREWESAQAELRQYNTITVGKVHRHRDGLDELTCEICMAADARVEAAAEAAIKAANAERQYKEMMEDVKRAKTAVPQPDWDRDFRPFDPWLDFQKPRPVPTTRRALSSPPQASPAGGLGNPGNR